MQRKTILIVSDIHFACAAEQARRGHEGRAIKNPLLRLAVKLFRHYIWLRAPTEQNHLLDQFISRAGKPDLVIANGDYSCDSAFLGVSDDASFASAQQCLQKLRAEFAPDFKAVFGDHELGKVSFYGNRGGMRVASFHRAEKELGIEPFWRLEFGNYVLLGVVSSLVALPVFEPDALPEEFSEWTRLREDHLVKIRGAFACLKPEQKIILFCHDPTALPFLWEEAAVRDKLPQLEQTIIGHLHSPLILWKGRMIAGMPAIRFLGTTIKRSTTALQRARIWRHFHVRLCPSLAGIELLKDGGYLSVELDVTGQTPASFQRHRINR
ncbi:MAG: metallophosphoesterase [Verrucomicrobiota bacterium]